MLCEWRQFHPRLSVSLNNNDFITCMTTQSFLGCGLNDTLVIIDRLGCFSSQLAVGRKITLVFIVLVKFGGNCISFLSYRSCRISEHRSVINLTCLLN